MDRTPSQQLRNLITFTALTIISPLALAYQINFYSPQGMSYFPVTPRLTLQGSGASGAVIGAGDSLIPLFGSRDNGIFFTDMGGAGDNHDAYAISPGAGLRFLYNNQILGSYLFGDYSQTNGNGNYFVVNPGIEWMSPRWDAHINGYFPTEHEKRIQNLGFANTLGNYNFVTFKGHTEFDQQLAQFGVVANGGDAELGYSFSIRNLRSRVYAGGYHYAPSQVSSITGAQVGFEYPLTRTATVILSGSEDNVFKTNGAISLRFTFGNPCQNISPDVRDRIVDPIPRHLGTLNTAAAIPSQQLIKNTGESLPFLRNIWFFLPGSTTAAGVTIEQCTIENPCVGLNQNIINSINGLDPNAIFYFAPGQYFPVATPTPGAGILTLANGQSFWGRNAGYVTPASGANRAVMNGVLELTGNNILDSLQVVNNSVEDNLPPYGNNIVNVNVLGSATGTNQINNLNMVAIDNNNGAFNLFIAGNSTVSVTNSTMDATQNNSASANGAENIATTGNTHLTVNNSILNATDDNAGGDGGAFGLFIGSGAPTVTFNNSTFNTIENGINQVAVGILIASDGSNVSVNNSVLNSLVTDANNVVGAHDVIMQSNSILNINHSILNADDNGLLGAFGVKMSDGIANISNTIINTTDDGPGGSGGVVLFGGTANIDHTTINALQNGTGNGGAFGVELLGGGDTTITNSILNTIDNGTNGTSGVFVNGGTATVNQTTINTLENGSGEANGVFVKNGSATINGGQITAVGTGTGLVTGVNTTNSATINDNSTLFQLTANSGSAIGALANVNSNIDIINANFAQIFSQTGQASGVQNNGTGLISAFNSNFIIQGNGTSVFNSGAGPIVHTGGNCTVNGNPC